MDSVQLTETVMDPEKRVLKQVVLPNNAAAQLTVNTLMGTPVLPRKSFIEQNAKNAEIDI